MVVQRIIWEPMKSWDTPAYTGETMPPDIDSDKAYEVQCSECEEAILVYTGFNNHEYIDPHPCDFKKQRRTVNREAVLNHTINLVASMSGKVTPQDFTTFFTTIESLLKDKE